MNFHHLMLPKLENLKPQPYNSQGSGSLSPPIPAHRNPLRVVPKSQELELRLLARNDFRHFVAPRERLRAGW